MQDARHLLHTFKPLPLTTRSGRERGCVRLWAVMGKTLGAKALT